MTGGEWIATAVTAIALLEGLRRLLRRPARAVLHFLRECRNAVYDIRGYDTRNPRTGEVKHTKSMAERLAAVEQELTPNSGKSLRDRVDAVHDIAVDNNDRHVRIEQQLREAARTAGKAATTAAATSDGLAALRDETRRRHEENIRRFAELENNDRDHEILRELLLKSLRDNHGIDLLPDEDPDEDR